MNEPRPSSEETGLSMPANWMAGIMVPMIVTNSAAIWLRVEGGGKQAETGREQDKQQRCYRQRRKTAFHRHPTLSRPAA